MWVMHRCGSPRRHEGQVPHGGSQLAMTRSPTARSVTPSPTAITSPAASCPSTAGTGWGSPPVTRPLPAGAIGNDKPIEVVTERWFSPDLQIAVMTVHTDPMMGTVTTKLVNIARGDPDASLFQVPADYKIEAGKPNEPLYMPMKP